MKSQDSKLGNFLSRCLRVFPITTAVKTKKLLAWACQKRSLQRVSPNRTDCANTSVQWKAQQMVKATLEILFSTPWDLHCSLWTEIYTEKEMKISRSKNCSPKRFGKIKIMNINDDLMETHQLFHICDCFMQSRFQFDNLIEAISFKFL